MLKPIYRELDGGSTYVGKYNTELLTKSLFRYVPPQEICPRHFVFVALANVETLQFQSKPVSCLYIQMRTLVIRLTRKVKPRRQKLTSNVSSKHEIFGHSLQHCVNRAGNNLPSPQAVLHRGNVIRKFCRTCGILVILFLFNVQ